MIFEAAKVRSRLTVGTVPKLCRYWNGAIAQLGERLHGMQEVSGSIPLGSTKLRVYERQGDKAPLSPSIFFFVFKAIQ